MARKIEREIAGAVAMKKPITRGNTTFDGSTVYLHGNPILHVSPYGAVEINLLTCRRWPTATTRSRVNGILSELGLWSTGLCQRKGELMLCYSDESMMEAWKVGSDFVYAGAITNYLREK